MSILICNRDVCLNHVDPDWKYRCRFERELADTNAYKLQPSLSESTVVDGHGCHTARHFGVKAKENQERVPTLYWLHKLRKNPIKQDSLLILVLVRQKNFLNC